MLYTAMFHGAWQPINTTDVNVKYPMNFPFLFYDRDSRSFVPYDKKEGPFDIRFRDEIRLNNRQIVFRGDGGLVKLDPGIFRNRKNLKRPVITRFLLYNQEVNSNLNRQNLNKDITETR
jgi:hypothetical protein